MEEERGINEGINLDHSRTEKQIKCADCDCDNDNVTGNCLSYKNAQIPTQDTCSASSYTEILAEEISGINDADSHETEMVDVEETLKHIDQHLVEIHEPFHKSTGLLQKLKSGNLFLSRKNKCFNVITKGIACGAQKFSRHSLKVSSFSKDMSPLPVELHGKHGACVLALKTLREYNNETLVQEKWLVETSHLFNNRILSIGVFGRHKAGKSTVLNALLHQHILPSAVKNETASLTRLYHDQRKHISRLCPTESCQDCPIMESHSKTEVSGRQKIRKTIRDDNSAIREGNSVPKSLGGHRVVACVPFMCPYSPGDIQVVLMDTPGLSEANELGISEIAEHHLMTCSAYIYVISCTQLEDQIDIETLKAVFERDPGVFVQKRMLIVVTRLDEYRESQRKYNDDTVVNIDPDSDEEEESFDFSGLISSIKEIVQRQCKSFADIPKECIIPVSATGALEARKEQLGEKSRDSDLLLLKLKKIVGKLITIEELNEYSQLPILEESLGHVVLNANRIWTHAIVRDCSRYLERAIIELSSIEDEFRLIEKDCATKRNEKTKTWTDYKQEMTKLRTRYDNGSDFHRSLESSYDNDVKSFHSLIAEKCGDEFRCFEASMKQKKQIFQYQYRQEAEKFIEGANKSLMSKFEHLQFHQMDEVIRRSYFNLGQECENLKCLMVAYCEIQNETSFIENETSFERTRIESFSDLLNETPARTAPLELKELLKHGTLDYTILDKLKIFVQKVFLRHENEDPRRELVDTELDALLAELRRSLVNDSKEYFKNIKAKIVNSYIEEQRKCVDNHKDDLNEHYGKKRKEMKEMVKQWSRRADLFGKFADRQKMQIEFLTKQKVNLNYLYTQQFQ